jgi:hypothetical protein
MNFFDFVLFVLLISAVGGLVKVLGGGRAGHPVGERNSANADENDGVAIVDEELKRRISDMESRIRVLERITTDTAARTASEIENLR